MAARDGAAASGAASPPRLPERPRLADGVSLAGQMQESAFQDPPWLLEREGSGYIQVTELLYRVAEQMDGQRGYQEIARRVSEVSGRAVTAENVQQLVMAQFVAKGLVLTADGRRLGTPPGSGRSMLQINMRMRMLEGKALEPLTRILGLLFWPPVLVVVLAVATLTEGWLYFVHGVGAGVRDALYAPGLLLLILAVTAVSAGFHELGHASALHYGGGRARGIGAGFYLVYPAFYTDVSDNYRLGRWARVRTDLGGFYFNLVFALGAMGLYVLTGQEVLLVLVTLLNLDIVRQLLPFVRLDGYWVLADLTGVPDFFSLMSRYARGALPFGTKKGEPAPSAPALKPWAKVVFALYALVTIPLLALLTLAMIRGLPRVLATIFDSAAQQLPLLAQEQAAGNAAGMAVVFGRLLALALPTLGIFYSLFRLGRRLFSSLWRWSAPTPSRRLMGALGTLSVVGLLWWAWAPALPFGLGGRIAAPVRFEPIQPGERGTVGDVVAGVVAPSAHRPSAGEPPPPDPIPGPARSPVAAVASPSASPTLLLDRQPTVLSPSATPTSVLLATAEATLSAPIATAAAPAVVPPPVLPAPVAPPVPAPAPAAPPASAPTPLPTAAAGGPPAGTPLASIASPGVTVTATPTPRTSVVPRPSGTATPAGTPLPTPTP